MSRSTLMRLGLVIAALTVVQCVAFIPFFNFNGEAASEEAAPIDLLLQVMIGLSSFVFAVVLVMGVWLAWTFRAKPGDESDGEPIHGNTRLEIAWTAIPTVIVLGCAIYSWVVLSDIEAKEPDRMVINVTGEQFVWSFEYPDADVESTELVVPVDKQIEFKLGSKDVIHSFWVPQWRIKQDAVPGMETTAIVTPNKVGSYPLVCTELCGLGHATMRAPVRTVSQADFDKWLAEKATSGDKVGGSVSGGDPSNDGTASGTDPTGGGDGPGAQVYAEQGCGSCHTFDPAGSVANVGPNLTESLRNRDKDFIRTSIIKPGAEIANGFSNGIMPAIYSDELSSKEIDDLVDFLASGASK